MTAKLLNCSEGADLKQHLLTKLRFPNAADGIEAMEQLGLLSDDPCEGKDTPLDTLAHHLAETLRYGPEERDLVVLNHDIQAQLSDGVLVKILNCSYHLRALLKLDQFLKKVNNCLTNYDQKAENLTKLDISISN